jgi:hypothetical protein
VGDGVDWLLLLLLLLLLVSLLLLVEVVMLVVVAWRLGGASEDVQGTEGKEDGAVDRTE